MRLARCIAARVLAAAVALSGGSAARAGILVSEDFNYGGTSGSLNGQNGGTGFSGGWSGGNYSSTGLTFSTLISSGGSYFASATSGRAFTAALGTSFYGSFLFQYTTQLATVQMVGFGTGLTANNQAANELRLQPSSDAGGGDKRPTVAGPNVGETSLGTGTLANNTPYLYLFHYSSASVTSWVLTSSQYDNFVAGGLQESALNAATIGSGSTNVTGRATSNGSGTPNLANLNMYTFGGGNMLIDRLYISNTSLNETLAAVPEPSSLALAGIVAALGGASAWRRRSRPAAH
ncbi:MAG: PEP-CTERM sorting domain-containing protein [Isosphaeraceae bacterium]